jgi:hypothetical protein
LQHPVLATVDPWLLRIAILFFVGAVGVAVWSYFEEGAVYGWRKIFSFSVLGLFFVAVTKICNPGLDDTVRLQDAAALATIICGGLALVEAGFWERRIRPFKFLTYVLLAAQAMPVALSVPSYLKSGLNHAATSLASLPSTYVTALAILVLLLTGINQVLDLFKTR